MTILLTGVAGFIGFHLADALLRQGRAVLGVDELNAYYEVSLKQARLARLEGRPGFRFVKGDIAEAGLLDGLAEAEPPTTIIHLAAQAGVRYSLENPEAYIHANILGHFRVLELARRLGSRLGHLVYASSSSVYGDGEGAGRVDQKVDRAVSLYAATKIADELMTQTYAHLHRIRATGLRFFTVYGPWGRPDMAPFIFARAVLEGRPIPLFNQGRMRRDFTYIDDIVAGVLAVLDRPPEDDGATAPHRLYNIGNGRPEPLLRFIAAIEAAAGRPAILDPRPMQPGDVRSTAADITETTRDFGYRPQTTIEEGVPRFMAWFRGYYGI